MQKRERLLRCMGPLQLLRCCFVFAALEQPQPQLLRQVTELLASHVALLTPLQLATLVRVLAKAPRDAVATALLDAALLAAVQSRSKLSAHHWGALQRDLQRIEGLVPLLHADAGKSRRGRQGAPKPRPRSPSWSLQQGLSTLV